MQLILMQWQPNSIARVPKPIAKVSNTIAIMCEILLLNSIESHLQKKPVMLKTQLVQK